jgi:hypothetical protein
MTEARPPGRRLAPTMLVRRPERAAPMGVVMATPAPATGDAADEPDPGAVAARRKAGRLSWLEPRERLRGGKAPPPAPPSAFACRAEAREK